MVLTEPLGYAEFAHLMARARLVVTDSGGVQEEAPGLGKPVLVLRDTTERPEGVEAGVVRLIGTDRRRVADEVERLLTEPAAYAAMARAVNPYGDGEAAQRSQARSGACSAWATCRRRSSPATSSGGSAGPVSAQDADESYERGVAVIGLGYIGLPTSAVLADHGVRVHGVDTDPRVVDAVNRGECTSSSPTSTRSCVASSTRDALGDRRDGARPTSTSSPYLRRSSGTTSRTCATSSRRRARSPRCCAAVSWSSWSRPALRERPR